MRKFRKPAPKGRNKKGVSARAGAMAGKRAQAKELENEFVATLFVHVGDDESEKNPLA